MVVSAQPNFWSTQPTTAVYAPSAQITARRGSSGSRPSTTLAPSRSCTFAGKTAKPQIRPTVSTSTCRLRPPIFFPRVVPLGAAGLGRLDGLAVEHAGRRRRLATVQLAQVHPQDGVDLGDQPGIAPGVEVVGQAVTYAFNN